MCICRPLWVPQTLTRQGSINNLLLLLTHTFHTVIQVSEVWSPSTTTWTTRQTSPGPLALGHRALLSPFGLPQVRLLPNRLVTELVCPFYAHLPGDSLPLRCVFLLCYVQYLKDDTEVTALWMYTVVVVVTAVFFLFLLLLYWSSSIFFSFLSMRKCTKNQNISPTEDLSNLGSWDFQ